MINLIRIFLSLVFQLIDPPIFQAYLQATAPTYPPSSSTIKSQPFRAPAQVRGRPAGRLGLPYSFIIIIIITLPWVAPRPRPRPSPGTYGLTLISLNWFLLSYVMRYASRAEQTHTHTHARAHTHTHTHTHISVSHIYTQYYIFYFLLPTNRRRTCLMRSGPGKCAAQ